MSFGEKLKALRKKEGLSQEEVAHRLNVTRQTVSKWETDQTVPQLIKAKLLSELYDVSYVYLMGEGGGDFDATDMDRLAGEIDWTSAWSRKYPILAAYGRLPGVDTYCEKVWDLYDALKGEFAFSHLDAFLVLKDMVYKKYRIENRKEI